MLSIRWWNFVFKFKEEGFHYCFASRHITSIDHRSKNTWRESGCAVVSRTSSIVAGICCVGTSRHNRRTDILKLCWRQVVCWGQNADICPCRRHVADMSPTSAAKSSREAESEEDLVVRGRSFETFGHVESINRKKTQTYFVNHKTHEFWKWSVPIYLRAHKFVNSHSHIS